MKRATAKKILSEVKNSYSIISNEFSDTRHHSWKEFDFFKPYLFEGAEIVDLGCGNGRLVNFLDQHFLSSNFKYIGIDNNEALLEKAHQLFPRNAFLPGDQLEIPIDNHQVDLIFNIAAFHHIPSRELREQALLEMNRVLKPDGILIMSVWNLWQKKYWLENLKAWLRYVISFGRFAPNDLYIPWKNGKQKTLVKRYYHNFLPIELKKLLKLSGFTLMEEFAVKKGRKRPFFQSFNYILIAKKS